MTLFLALPSLQTSKGNSLSGALNIRGVKICDFDRIPDYDNLYSPPSGRKKEEKNNNNLTKLNYYNIHSTISSRN